MLTIIIIITTVFTSSLIDSFSNFSFQFQNILRMSSEKYVFIVHKLELQVPIDDKGLIGLRMESKVEERNSIRKMET